MAHHLIYLKPIKCLILLQFSTEVSISKSLTLEGSANTVIDGNASKIMEVTADATVVLTNLSFTNGNDALVGAISNEGKLTISNSNFYSNKATGNSGTIITNKNKYSLTIQTKKKYKEIWISNLDKCYLEIYSAYESLNDLEEYVLNKFQENKEVVKYTKKKRI